MSRTVPGPRRRLPRVEPLARPAVQLWLTSAALLFVELLLIRWIPANVKYVGFFSNFLLMASFLGIGLGLLLGRRSVELPASPFPAFLALLVFLVLGAQLNLEVPAGDEVFFGLSDSTGADVNYLVLPLVVGLVVALMAALSLPLGPLLRSMPPLTAYAIDIAGSMTGVAAFAAISIAQLGPVVWFSIIGLVLLVLAAGRGITPWSAVGGAAMLAAIVAVGATDLATHDTWSPYYRISAYGPPDGHHVSTDPRDEQEPRALAVDGIPHQTMLTAAEAAASPLHRQIYRWYPDRAFRNVLVIGAGSGSDVALALARNAGHVDAVEIDPELARIGRDFHPERVYSDPRVNLVVNDGRAFLRNATGTYDLIVFALTDSLTLVTSTGNIRLESFLFTEEALAGARDRLAADGIFVMYNIYREPWLVAKLHAMTTAVFGHEPALRLVTASEAVIAAGPGLVATGARPPGDRVDALPALAGSPPTPATDDWPFLYLRNPAIAPHYLVALAFLIGLAIVGVLVAGRAGGATRAFVSPHFFVLGMAFLLIETRSLVSFSLLFGTTWLVNALAIFAILSSVLLAIGLNRRFRWRGPTPLYVGLFASIAVAWIVPPDRILIEPPALRYVLATAISFAPVLFANLVFAYSFRDTAMADLAFASNLVGAMVGGALEYVALIAGFQALLPIVALLYGAAWLLATRLRLLGDGWLVGPALAGES